MRWMNGIGFCEGGKVLVEPNTSDAVEDVEVEPVCVSFYKH